MPVRLAATAISAAILIACQPTSSSINTDATVQVKVEATSASIATTIAQEAQRPPRAVGQVATQPLLPKATLVPSTAAAGSAMCSPSEQIQLRQINDPLAQWRDAENVAASTSRIALAGPISQLQTIRRAVSAMALPNCAVRYKQSLLAAMDAEINAFLSFEATAVQPNMDRATQLMINASNELAIAVGRPTATPIPTPRPLLQWVPGISGDDVVSFAESRQFKCTVAPDHWSWECYPLKQVTDYSAPHYSLSANGASAEKINKVSGSFTQSNKVIDVAAEADFLVYIAGLPYSGADSQWASAWVTNQLAAAADESVVEETIVIGGGTLHLWGMAGPGFFERFLDISPGYAT